MKIEPTLPSLAKVVVEPRNTYVARLDDKFDQILAANERARKDLGNLLFYFYKEVMDALSSIPKTRPDNKSKITVSYFHIGGGISMPRETLFDFIGEISLSVHQECIPKYEDVKSRHMPKIREAMHKFDPISITATEFLNAILGESNMIRLDDDEECSRVHMYIVYRDKVYELHEEDITHPINKTVVNEKLTPEALENPSFLESCRRSEGGVNAYTVSNPSRVITLEDLLGYALRRMQGKGPLIAQTIASIGIISLREF